MKKYFIVIGFILCLSALVIGWWNYFKQKQINQYTRSIIGEKIYLEDSFKNFLSTDTICIDSIWVEHKEQAIKLSDIVSFPCLVIYLPSTEEEICGSCIKYALNSVKTNFGNILENNHICLISVSENPAIKKRVYQKDCYVAQTPLCTVSILSERIAQRIYNTVSKIYGFYIPNLKILTVKSGQTLSLMIIYMLFLSPINRDYANKHMLLNMYYSL